MNVKQKDANLRVCASCEWVFLRTDSQSCPKCGFAHYGARFVYGNKAYRYAKTQEPWIKRKMDAYYLELVSELPKASNNKTALHVGEYDELPMSMKCACTKGKQV